MSQLARNFEGSRNVDDELSFIQCGMDLFVIGDNAFCNGNWRQFIGVNVPCKVSVRPAPTADRSFE
ncbi:hypothetical protein Q094_04467 [Pseudomonas aeruginosa PS42]|nr:hypothetical protein Q094_04467 [Pseudomonas aeruginosa PS42]